MNSDSDEDEIEVIRFADIYDDDIYVDEAKELSFVSGEENELESANGQLDEHPGADDGDFA